MRFFCLTLLAVVLLASGGCNAVTNVGTVTCPFYSKESPVPVKSCAVISVSAFHEQPAIARPSSKGAHLVGEGVSAAFQNMGIESRWVRAEFAGQVPIKLAELRADAAAYELFLLVEMKSYTKLNNGSEYLVVQLRFLTSGGEEIATYELFTAGELMGPGYPGSHHFDTTALARVLISPDGKLVNTLPKKRMVGP